VTCANELHHIDEGSARYPEVSLCMQKLAERAEHVGLVEDAVLADLAVGWHGDVSASASIHPLRWQR
jgi:hypothetical protein